VADAEGIPEGDLADRLEKARRKLEQERAHREHPFRDEKVLVSWNSFVLRALAEAGSALDKTDYLEAARANAEFLLESLREDGRLLRSWKDGQSKIPAFLEDYAGLGNALLSLYEVTLEQRWLEEAKALSDQLIELFWEEEQGLFFDTAKDGEELIVRPRESMDNATPSGNSLATELLLRISTLFGQTEYRRIALRTLIREAGAMTRFPSAFGRLLSVLSISLTSPLEVVLVGKAAGEGELADFIEAANRDFLPSRVVAGGNPENLPPLPIFEGRGPVDAAVTAYVCRDFTCSLPMTEVEVLRETLGESVRRPEGWSL
jgi:uncharacterized protein YyaL (SSP411 family)